MKYELSKSASFPYIEFELNPKESIDYEVGAMIYFEKDIKIRGKANGGIIKGVAKKIFTNEAFFCGNALNEGSSNQKVGIAPRGIGEITVVDIKDTQWFLSDGSYLASENSVEMSVGKQQGIIKGFIGSTGGLFVLKSSGTGKLAISGFGALKTIEIKDEEIYIDTGHVVAWEETVKYNIRKAGTIFSSYKSGEGLVMKFSGSGKIIMQSRHIENFVQTLLPFFPKQISNIEK